MSVSYQQHVPGGPNLHPNASPAPPHAHQPDQANQFGPTTVFKVLCLSIPPVLVDLDLGEHTASQKCRSSLNMNDHMASRALAIALAIR